MTLKHFVSWTACLSLALGVGVAARAQTKQYAVIGGGGQMAMGWVLPLPVQIFTAAATMSVFPPLLIPVRSGPPPVVSQTTAMATRQKLQIQQSVFQVAPAQRTVGVFVQHPDLYAVATNLGFAWPAAPATLSVSGRAGANVTVFTTNVGGTAAITYTASAAGKFGGAARFAITHGSGGRIANAPVTIYEIVFGGFYGAGNPPCTHTALAGPNPACIAWLVGAWPLTQGPIGGTTGVWAMTSPLGNPVPGVGFGKFGASPLGTVSSFVFTPNGNPGGTDRATSVGYPWTAGRITLVHPFAYGAASTITITGMDSRTPGGAGTIQLVSGSLSTRRFSGPTANRGWVRLELREINRTPALSPGGLAAMTVFLALAGAYDVRRRLSA